MIDEFPYPTRDASAEPFAPPLAAVLEDLDPEEVAAGLWRDEFLALGTSLRGLYGNAVTLDCAAVAYVVACGGVDVFVGWSDERPRAQRVAIGCRLGTPSRFSDRLSALALRAHGRPALVRIALQGEELWAENELALDAARGPQLSGAVAAVAMAARRLQAQLPGSLDEPG